MEPELHLASDILVPDEPFLTLAPDWVAEIVSPSTARLDRVHKPAVYAREHVAHVWLLDPGTRILEVLALEEARWVIHATFGQDARDHQDKTYSFCDAWKGSWAGQRLLRRGPDCARRLQVRSKPAASASRTSGNRSRCARSSSLVVTTNRSSRPDTAAVTGHLVARERGRQPACADFASRPRACRRPSAVWASPRPAIQTGSLD